MLKASEDRSLAPRHEEASGCCWTQEW